MTLTPLTTFFIGIAVGILYPWMSKQLAKTFDFTTCDKDDLLTKNPRANVDLLLVNGTLRNAHGRTTAEQAKLN